MPKIMCHVASYSPRQFQESWNILFPLFICGTLKLQLFPVTNFCFFCYIVSKTAEFNTSKNLICE